MAEKIEITFLGTGSAVPTARRNHQAVLLKYRSENILFDCGEGTQRQFRRAKINPCKITKIFISHWHGDHVLGLPGLIQTILMNGYSGVLEVYGPVGTQRNFSEMVLPHLGFYLKASRNEGFNFDIKVHDCFPGNVILDDEFEINCELTDHFVKSLCYSFIVPEKNRIDKKKLEKLNILNGPIIGELSRGKLVKVDGKIIDGKKLLYKEPGRKITIISDTRKVDLLVSFANNSDVLISESTYSKEETEIAEKHFHLTSTQAAGIAKKSKSKSLVLVHLSQRYDEIPKLILKEAREIFKNSSVAEDLDKIEI